MQILILGGTGMLGHKMFQVLRQKIVDTHCTIRGSLRDQPFGDMQLFQQGNVIENFDAAEFADVRQILSQYKPRIIVNCIGVIKQRLEARSPIPSIAINALLPHQLAELCSRWAGRLIHFSTDCVFSGKTGAYREDDFADASDLYGRSKFLGEVTSANSLTLRTSIIGREINHSTSLLEWFIGKNHESVRGFTRAIFSGVTTNWLAETVAHLIENHPALTGLYHVASQPISKYQLLCLLKEKYRLDVEIAADDSFHCDRSLLGDKFVNATGRACPSWPELAAQLAADPTPYDQWRMLLHETV